MCSKCIMSLKYFIYYSYNLYERIYIFIYTFLKYLQTYLFHLLLKILSTQVRIFFYNICQRNVDIKMIILLLKFNILL